MLLDIINKITTNLLDETNLSKEIDLENIKEKTIKFLTELKKEYHLKKIVWNVNKKGFRFGNYIAYQLKDPNSYDVGYELTEEDAQNRKTNLLNEGYQEVQIEQIDIPQT